MDGAAADAERLRRLNSLLETALALPEDEREAWLQALPQEHQPLVALIGAMLERAEVETDTFMARPLGVGIEDLDDYEVRLDRAGDLVGPYRLIRELGAGGMATVWLAERADGSLHRQVALKLPRAGWALGLAQRMARERDILAGLEHPRIARLYDAGVTERGRPYLAMEYIDGVAINVYWRERKPTVEQGLRLFLQVADAVSYAHCRLIIHSDLKPSNILVTADGDIRLLDFGVARLMADDGDTPLTQLLGRAFTPDYASPEQIRGKPLSLASDVYSLAVVLYELLTGQRPYRPKRATAAALEEAITDADVPLASARVGKDRRLERSLRGDIDTVLVKALKKRSRDRYPSVEAFAADIERHLTGRPVLARPDSLAYRGRKYVVRHRRAVLAGLMLAVAIAAGVVGTLSQAQRAERLAERAEHERDAALQSLKFSVASEGFMRFLLSENANERLTTAELLDRADEVVDDQYASDPVLRTRMQLLVADLFASLADYKRVGQVLDRARASAQATGLPSLVADVDCQIGGLDVSAGRHDAAAARLGSTLTWLASTASAENDTWIACLGHRAHLRRREGKLDEMMEDTNLALQRMGTPQPAQLGDYLVLQSNAADYYLSVGKGGEAVRTYEQSIERFEKAGQGRTSAASVLYNNYAVMLARSGQWHAAARVYELGLAHAGVQGESGLGVNYGRLLVDLGRPLEAVPLLERALGERIDKGDGRGEAFATLAVARARCAIHDWEKCDAMLGAATDRMKAMLQPGDPTFAAIAVIVARSRLDRGDPIAARERLNEALALVGASSPLEPERQVGRARILTQLARVEVQIGDLRAAEAHASQAVGSAQAARAGFAGTEWLGSALLAQGIVDRAAGREAAARIALREAYEQLRDSVGGAAPPTVEARNLLAST